MTKKTAKSKPEESKTKSSARAQSLDLPDVPELVMSDEFHLPVEESKHRPITNPSIVKILLLVAVLIVIGVLVILVSHQDPLG